MDTAKAKMSPDMEALKTKLQAVWNAGDFGVIARSFESGAAEFADRIGLKAGMSILDVACGNGNTAIPAAKAGATVTGVDLISYLVEEAKERAANEGVEAKFEVGDAEALPYDEASFDAVVTMFGAMFAPRPDVVAGELLRVCKPGGIISMANWTAEGFIGQMFKVTGKHVPPPAGMPSPIFWGIEDVVKERFADGVSDIELERRMMRFDFPFGPAETVEHFRQYYGPTQKAFDSLDTDGQAALRSDLEELWSEANIATDGTTIVHSEYLDVRATRS
ncbi:MAG: class I SAM-dependent methyltransferase [Pyrinomonadaceae bacterium]|nr:class I SAM-dependent methyltransferase [Pyrinomonadaceae bacterium]